MEPCTVYLAPDDGDGLVAKGVAHQGGVLLHDRRPIVRTHLPRVLSSCSRGLIKYLEVDRDLDIKEDGFAHFTNSVLYLAP